jgi:hypothetical protein
VPRPATCHIAARTTVRAAAQRSGMFVNKIHPGELLSGNYPPGEVAKAENTALLAAADADGPAETGADPS